MSFENFQKNKMEKQEQKLNIVEVEIDKLTPYEKNAKLHPQEQIDQIVKSIQELGFNDPIGIWSDKNIVVTGHGRLLAAKQLGLQQVPCIRLDHLSEQERKAYALIHNQTTMNSGWDNELLKIELDDLQEFDMSVFGFDDILQIDELDKIVEDNIPEPPQEPVTKLGDIWQLGNHRLICGDCTDSKVVSSLMDGIEADIVITDPPYNVDYENKIDSVHRWRKTVSTSHGVSGKCKRIDSGNGLTNIKNDKMSDREFTEFLKTSLSATERHTRAGGAIYCFHSGAKSIEFMTAFNASFVYNQTLIWVKPHFVMSKLPYHYKHEPILFGYKDGGKRYFVDSRSQDTVIEDKGVDFKKMRKDELLKYVENLTADAVPTTVIKEHIVQSCDVHPTMKPVKLVARLMRDGSKQGDNVLDPFGGSGTTLIAAEQIGRTCYMAELEPKYCDVIIKRWETLTKQKAVRIEK